MITLRLDPKLEQRINNAAKHLGVSKSELVRKSLVEYIGKLSKQNAWEAGQELFGKYASGNNDLSTNRKVLLKEKLSNKKA